jgi:diaminohydroxyphosphoribosylaminopyrimidine deaminase/5-amino-6-(5-phosphoribosylamino)uracil reductase
MRQALALARRGAGRTSPNPMVGAVIVRGERVIGRGYHRYFGGQHAEVNALESASEDVAGATLYVTLEPCCHHGKTPPCTDAIIRHGIGRVVIGMLDPFPEMQGKSMTLLREHGIEVTVGVLEDACRALNEAYLKHVTTGRPLVTLKFAQTLDGRIATTTRDSKWLSSEASRRLAHRLRAESDAVMIGAGTARADDPELTVRLARGRNPLRLVLDSKLMKTPTEAKLLAGQKDAPTLIVAARGADAARAAELCRHGAEVLFVEADAQGKVDLVHMLELLGQRGIASLLVEGGAGLITALLQQKLADRLVVFVTPRIMGSGIEAVGELNIAEVSRTIPLSFEKVSRLGGDVVIRARIDYP